MTLAQKREMEDLYTTYSDRIDRDNPDGNVTTNCFLFGLEQAVAILGYRFECVYTKNLKELNFALIGLLESNENKSREKSSLQDKEK